MAPAKKAAKKATKKSTSKRSTAKKAANKTSNAKKTAKKTAKRAAKKASKTAKKATSSAKSVGNVLVASKIKEAVKAQDVRMASDFPEALNAEVEQLIARATQRAQDNGRGTVRPSDL